MMAEAARVKISQQEAKTLNWLSAYVKHQGRYPIPTNMKQMASHPDEDFGIVIDQVGNVKIHSSASDHLKTAETLVERLLEQLRP